MDGIDYDALSELIREQIEWDKQYWWGEEDADYKHSSQSRESQSHQENRHQA